MDDTESVNGAGGPPDGAAGGAVPLSTIYDRFRQWRDYCATRIQTSRPTVLAPWDENTWFELPTVTTVRLLPGPPFQQLVAANPRRVGLIISTDGGAIAWIRPGPGQPVNQFNQDGITLSLATPSMEFYQSTSGVLAAMDWWVLNTVQQVFTTIELVLKDFPIAR